MLSFEWDPEKAASNLGKHGVSFEEAATVFGDPLSLTVYDPDHSLDEDRFITMGMSSENRIVLLAHTDPNPHQQRSTGNFARAKGVRE